MTHIHDEFEQRARNGDGLFAIAFALLELANAQKSTATWLKYLGNGDAATTMGAIEAFGDHIGKKLDDMTDALRDGDA
jgi:hypothetical protein